MLKTRNLERNVQVESRKLRICLVNVSQGLKAGLAGWCHLWPHGWSPSSWHLEVCSPTTLQSIGERLSQLSPPSNVTAEELFSTDTVYFPMINGIWALLYGVAFGPLFAAVYPHLPGSNSKRKGMVARDWSPDRWDSSLARHSFLTLAHLPIFH